MKISDSSSVRGSVSVGSSGDLLAKLSGIKKGDTVQAAIISRKGNEALLDIKGKRIRADFLKGVPAGNSIELTLAEKNSRNVVFHIAGGRNSFPGMELFSGAVILSDEELADFPAHNLARFINNSSPGLFDITLFLLGIKRDVRKDREFSGILKNMLKKGFSPETVSYFSLVFNGKPGASVFLPFLYSLMLPGREKGFRDSSEREKMDGEIESFLEGADDESLSILIDRISSQSEDGACSGFFLLPDEEDTCMVSYAVHGESCIADLELSALGRVSVLIKRAADGVVINFFAEKEEALDYLRDKKSVLSGLLEQNNEKKAEIGYYNIKKVVDKMSIWSTDFYIKSGFDVKI